VIPEYLYHYTSVDTLALILQNRTIRFNSLDKMDDNLEQWSAHGIQEGKHVFISSWTDHSEEIPDMWKMYCKPGPEVGVRIKLPANPFSTTKNHFPNAMEQCFYKQAVLIEKFVYETLGIHTGLGLEEDKILFQKALDKRPEEKENLKKEMDKITHETVACYTKNLYDILLQVEYTNEKNKLFPWMYYDYQGDHFEVYENYGKYKDTSWSWQYEWRYRLHFRMATPGIQHRDGSIELYPLPFEYYDLILDEEKLKQMEITMSPDISEVEARKLEQVVAQYNPSAKIYVSTLESLE